MFHPDKPIGKLLSTLFDQLVLSILFALCTLPVFTSGVAGIALCETQIAIHESRDENLIKDFFRAFLRNFKNGLLVFLTVVIFVIVALGICGSAILLNLPVNWILVILVFLYGCVGSWLIPLLARFSQTYSITLQNAYLLALQNLPTTLGMLAINFGFPLLILLMPAELFSGYLFILIFLFPGFSSYFSSKLFLRLIEKHYPTDAG